MLFFAIPFIFETEAIMKLWLKNYPPEAPLFLRLSIIGTLFDILGNSTANAAWATGNVKHYYIIVGGVGCLVFPLSWIAFQLGYGAYSSYIVFMIIYLLLVFFKLYIIKGLIKFPVKDFYHKVFNRIIPVTLTAFILPGLVYYNMPSSFFRVIIIIIVSFISSTILIFGIGMTKMERDKVYKFIKRKVLKNRE